MEKFYPLTFTYVFLATRPPPPFFFWGGGGGVGGGGGGSGGGGSGSGVLGGDGDPKICP